MSDKLPNFSQQPDAPQPVGRGASYPWVIDQRWSDDGLVYVTFALPGLRRAIVAVPYEVWIVGGHLPIGRELPALVDQWSA